MNRQTNICLRAKSLRFSHFSRKGYALFSVLGREVLIGTLSVATLSHAKAESISIMPEVAADSLTRSELKLDEVVVTGSRAPLTQAEVAKIVSVITRDDINRAAVSTVNDVLKLATGVDVRQRGGFGVQTDISIGGGTFDQIAILLNGVNISNPQTGHLSADFPVTLDDIERIEILEGAASRVYGAQAFNGAINIVTTRGNGDVKEGLHGSVALEGGSYGTVGAMARGAHEAGPWSNSISMQYQQSDGGTTNSYFRRSNGFYQGLYRQDDFSLAWQYGISTKRYGANTFYSAAYPNQYESNMRMFANVKGDYVALTTDALKLRLTGNAYWNRNYDHFQLIRLSTTGENFHRNDVLGAMLNADFDWSLGRTSVGAELRKESILSTNLGVQMQEQDYEKVPGHDTYYNKEKGRTDLSLFLEHNVVLQQFTATVGVVANRNTGFNDSFRFYPGIDLAYRPTDNLKVTLGCDMAFRLPTFTDLFYKSPTNLGNQDLKPEKTTSLRLAAQYRAGIIALRPSLFYSWGTDMIDWVMYSADDVYHSANFKLDNRGASLDADVTPFMCCHATALKNAKLHLGYAFIDQKRSDDVQIFKSNYAMEYLKHKFVADLSDVLYQSHDHGSLEATLSYRWQQRMGSYIIYEDNKSTGVASSYHPYGLLDLKLNWTAPRYEIGLTMNNLTSYRYYDLGNILQPGFWMMASAKYKF